VTALLVIRSTLWLARTRWVGAWLIHEPEEKAVRYCDRNNIDARSVRQSLPRPAKVCCTLQYGLVEGFPLDDEVRSRTTCAHDDRVRSSGLWSAVAIGSSQNATPYACCGHRTKKQRQFGERMARSHGYDLGQARPATRPQTRRARSPASPAPVGSPLLTDLSETLKSWGVSGTQPSNPTLAVVRSGHETSRLSLPTRISKDEGT
jgi:hypothetical protein